MRPWDYFFKQKISKILQDNKTIIDIGGGLRVLKNKGNRYDKSRQWILPLLKQVDYKILDPSPDYNPDIIGNIHHLPFKDNSVEAIICLAILEHVEDPFLACREIKRVLKPGGYCFVYLPFLYYYHAEKNYYYDYWRFTKDSLPLLFKGFFDMQICSVRGAMATWLKISPLGKNRILARLFDFLDIIFKKTTSNQVSGYYVFLVK